MSEYPPKNKIELTDEQPSVTLSPGGSSPTEAPPKTPASRNDAEAPEPAASGIGDSRAEIRGTLRSSVSELSSLGRSENVAESKESKESRSLHQAIELAKNAHVENERAALTVLTGVRRDALKDYLRAESAYRKTKKPTATQTAEFEAARARYAPVDEQFGAMQLKYAKALQGSVRERLIADGRDEAYIEKVSARYNSWIRNKEVVMPKIRQEQEVREELLDEPGKGIFRKSFRWYQKANKKLESKLKERIIQKSENRFLSDVEAGKRARYQARYIRVLGLAALGLGVGTGAAAAGGAASLGGAAILGKLGWRALSFAVGTVGGLKLGDRFDRTKGAARKAAHAETAQSKITSAEDLVAQQKSFESGSDEAVDASRAKRENLFALFSSLGLSASSLANSGTLESIQNAFKAIWHEFGISEAHAATPDIPSHLPTPGARIPVPPVPDELPHPRVGVPQTAAAAEPAVPAPAAVEAPPPGLEMSTIERGEGADTMFYEVREQLWERYGSDLRNAPASVRRIFEEYPRGRGAGHRLGAALGFSGPITAPDGHIVGQGSRMMYEGDQLTFNDRNELVFYDTRTNTTTVLIDANGNEHPMNDPLHLTGGARASSPINAAEGSSARNASEHADQSLNVAADDAAASAANANVREVSEAAPSATLPVESGSSHTEPTSGRLEDYQDAVSPVDQQAPAPTQSGSLPEQSGPSSGNLEDYRIQDSVPDAPASRIPDSAQPYPAQGGPTSGNLEDYRISWTSEQGLPQQRAVFSLNPESKLAIPGLRGDVLYAHTPSGAGLAWAQEYGRLHPGITIAFDNSQYDLLGVRTPQIGFVKFGDNGLAQDFNPRVLDRNGNPLTTFDAAQMSERIA